MVEDSRTARATSNVEPIRVYVFASDVIVELGVRSVLDSCDGLILVSDPDRAAVAVVAVDRVDDEFARIIGAVQRNGCPRVVAVVADVDDDGVMAGASLGVSGIVRRRDGDSALLAAVTAAARGEAAFPSDLVARLVSRLAVTRRTGTPDRAPGLSERDLDVLRLLAEGLDTADIAARLSFSERTIKGVIHDVTTRFQLKNRSHAVAYAVRTGLI